MPIEVLSSNTLTKAFAASLETSGRQTSASGFAPDVIAVAETLKPKRTALFAIHGISPTQRYAFQDQVAASLQSWLNAAEQVGKSATKWKSIVHWPTVDPKSDSRALRPSALRIYQAGDNPQKPEQPVFDVYEGYWSPLSKGKTNIVSALRWLLNSTFLPASSTANIPCDPKKLRSDLEYVGWLLLEILAALLFALGVGWFAWPRYLVLLGDASTPVDFLQLLLHPDLGLGALKGPGILELAIDLIAAYVLAQLVVALRSSAERVARTSELVSDAVQSGSQFKQETIDAATFHRVATRWLCVALIALIALAVLVGFFVTSDFANAIALVIFGALVAAVVGLLQFARSKADFAVEDVLGDIQIYTTHDSNLDFYAIRQSILQTVTNALAGVLAAVEGDSVDAPYYEAIHVFGHSLGSTVGLDVLIQVRQMVEQGALTEMQWGRIRSFTTFGTSLEKTRYFFDVRQPTINAAQDQWENDVFGRFFTDNILTLKQFDNRQGIYWSNLWYFRDIVSNEIVSYASDVNVGNSFSWVPNSPARPICQNHMLTNAKPRFAWVHSDYLNDPAFWGLVGPVVTRKP